MRAARSTNRVTERSLSVTPNEVRSTDPRHTDHTAAFSFAAVRDLARATLAATLSTPDAGAKSPSLSL
jgi:hypothetical protein